MIELRGFVLTSQWRDTADGLVLTFWLATDRGPARVRIEDERAVMFVEREASAGADERKPLELSTLWQTPVDALYFRRRADLVDERERLRREGVGVCESDIRPPARFLMERFITGGCRVRGRAREHDGHLDIVDARLRSDDYRPRLTALSIDIETDGADGPLFSIAAVDDELERVWMLGDGPPDPLVTYVPDEASLLARFFAFVRERDPDALIGWNVVEFDLTHLERRAQLHGLRLELGRGRERATILAPQNETQLPVARLPGRVALDGIQVLKAATYSFDNFSLEEVGRALLGRGKAIDKSADPVEEIRRLFHHDKLALARYNVEDCRLVRDIFAAADLLAFAVERQRMTGLPMDRVGGSVAAFDHLYLPRLHRHGFVAPDVVRVRDPSTSPGGYVLPSRPGLYENVLVLDYKSLYPSIIRTFMIDPMGMHLAHHREIDSIEGFDGARFSRDASILPELIATLWSERDRAKQASDKALSTAIKIVMNSFYGVLGTPGCRFYNPKLASSITRRGHEIITRSRDFIAERGREVIYGDTDSVFVLVGPGTEQAALAVGAELVSALNRFWTETLMKEHRTESHLEMELEVCYARFFMPTLRGSEEGSAKRYAGFVAARDELVIKGLEAVRTDWTHLARDFQRELLRRVFHDEPVEPYVRTTRQRLFAGELDEQLVYKKRLRRGVDAYVHNLPPHVKAARMLDRPVRDVAYLWTSRGPQPVEKADAPLDYHHYVEKQLVPASDAILACLGTSFDTIAGAQLRLF